MNARNLSLFCILTGLAAHAGGCAARLKPHTHRSRFFMAKKRCSQGPFSIRLTALGARWGERIQVHVHAPRRIKARYDMYVDGKTHMNGSFGFFSKPQNSMCVSSKAERTRSEAAASSRRRPDARGDSGDRGEAEKSGEGGGAGPVPGREDSTGETGDSGLVEVTAAQASRAVEDSKRKAKEKERGKEDAEATEGPERPRKQTYVLWQSKPQSAYTYELASVGLSRAPSYRSCRTDTDKPNTLEKGAKIRIRIWSEEPNDMEGVVFEVRHTVFRPNVSAGKWAAHVQKNLAACRRKAKKREIAESRRERERICTYDLINHHWLREETPKGVVLRPGMSYLLPGKLRKPCRCRENPNDPSCWGKEGMWDHLKGKAVECEKDVKDQDVLRYSVNDPHIRFDYRTRFFCIRNLDDVKCWGPGGYLAFRKRKIAELRARKAKEKERASHERAEENGPTGPTGPPPPPRKEKRPPSPGPGAVWVDGYWIWGNKRWNWFMGWWRMPKSSVASRARTGRRPPPPRSEVRSERPLPGAFWVKGYWAWYRGRWVWVPGGWRMLPSVVPRWPRRR